MKKLLLLTVILTLGGIPAWSQTTTGTTGSTVAPGTTTTPTGGGPLAQKLEGMTPEQRQQFLDNHPRLREQIRHNQEAKYENMTPAQKAQFSQNHPGFAQRLSNESQAGATTKDPGHPRVNEVNGRETNQQERIAQGVKSGELTPGEDKHLEKGEARIQNQEANDMAKHDGHLTKPEQNQLNREQNRESRRIHREKHNERTTTN